MSIQTYSPARTAMNKTFRSVWNERKQAYVAAAETASTGNQGSFSALALTAPVLAQLALATSALAADLPAGGQVAAGTGTIATNGDQMTIHQSTHKLAVDWQSFSIGQGKTVEFVQPSSSAVVLNRVLGTDVSVIQGALKSNGQVFLLNPNGVLFSKDAQVNVGGIVASTLNISTDDFMAGNYRFEGASSNAIVNQGNISSASGGSVALIAAKITNVGQINAERGNVLLGAGSKVRLDLGGPVKIEVEEGAINTLIEQGGGIRADGGLVYLTAKAVGQLTTTVINHTGITEARTLATDEKGAIYLMGGMDKDRIVVGGKLDASAPNSGDGGFVETSAAKLSFVNDVQITTAAANGQAGHWLIDPVDFKIAASGGDITGAALGALLNSNSVTIQTATGTNTSTNLYGTAGSNGDIIVSDAVTKTSGAGTTLTLAADRDIVIYDTGSISGSAGSPLNVVLAARANGGSTGTVTVMGTLRTYGGNITIGGGDMAASGYAVASAIYNNQRAYGGSPSTATYYTAGVDIGAMLDTTADGSGTNNATLPTAASGGNIVIRGKGNATATSSYNWGVHVDYLASRTHYATIVTGGSGSIEIVGYGGNGGSNNYALGSVGIAIEGTAYMKSKAGNISLKGYQGTGIDQYGIVTAGTTIGTKGWLLIDGDSLLLRGDTLTLAVGQDSDIKTPIVGCSSTLAYGICGSGAAQPKLVKQDTGILNLWGNAAAWNASRPANTGASYVGKAVYTDASNQVNLVGISSAQAFYAFAAPAVTATPVTQSSSAASIITLTYTLSDLGYSSPLNYKGSAYLLSDYLSTSDIFGASGNGLVLGTDYTFTYSGGTVTGFTNAGTYSGITISLTAAGTAKNYTLAATGNTNGSFKITPRTLSITAPTIASRDYDGGTTAGTLALGTLSGFVSGETVTARGSAAALSGKDVGIYTTTVSYTLANGTGGGLASNYALANSTGVGAVIAPRTLSITTPTIASRDYDGGTTAGTLALGTLSGFASGETVTASGSAAALSGKDVGNYTTTVSYALANGTGGGLASNYALANSTGVGAVIAPKALSITAYSDAKTYDGQAYSGGNGVSYSGFASNETSAVLSGTLAFAGNSQGARNTGSYAITPRGLSSSNYAIHYADGTLNITAAPTAVSAKEVAISTTQSLTALTSLQTAGSATSRTELQPQAHPMRSTEMAVQSGRGLVLVQGENPVSDDSPTPVGREKTVATPVAPHAQAGRDAAGFMRVFLVQGGMNTDFNQR